MQPKSGSGNHDESYDRNVGLYRAGISRGSGGAKHEHLWGKGHGRPRDVPFAASLQELNMSLAGLRCNNNELLWLITFHVGVEKLVLPRSFGSDSKCIGSRKCCTNSRHQLRLLRARPMQPVQGEGQISQRPVSAD